MSHTSASIKVGILFVALFAGSYGVWKAVGEAPSGESNFSLYARLADAAGLPEGSRVVIAGLEVGEIDELTIEGRHARVKLNLRDDLKLWDNAILFKKSSSLLGNFYLEIDPGTPTYPDATGKQVTHAPLKEGDEIIRVVEGTSVDALIRRIDQTMPKVDSVLLSVRDLSEDVRTIVNGPLHSMVKRLDRLVAEQTPTVTSILSRADRTIGKIELIAADIRAISKNADGRIDNILDNLDEASSEARGLVASARTEVETTGSLLREKIDSFDQIVEPTRSVIEKIDQDQGTLGRLVNDSTIADNIEEITDDARGFFGTLFGMQTYVGLRSEYNVRAGLARHYISIELQTRPDKFYYIELESGPRGGAPETTLVYDDALGQWRRDIVIEDRLRFTFQFAKRYDWLTLRYGLKESTGGVGADGAWFDNRLKLSLDAFEASFESLPRLKVTAAYEMFGFLYVLAGIDDALNSPQTLDIAPLDPGVGADFVPMALDQYRYGRDYFFGAMLRFNDLDLAALLTVGGAALAGVAN